MQTSPRTFPLLLAAALFALCGFAPACAQADEEAANAGARTAAPQVERRPSGLVLTHLRRGSGTRPRVTDTVAVHYHGTFLNGQVFDSTRGKRPATFPLQRVIPCWTEALQRMKVGGKAKLRCPAKIAYGARGFPPLIPPNATLLFEVELLAVQ